MQINLAPDFSLVVILAIFVANYWVVRKFFFEPVNRVLTERDSEIKGAEKLFEEALARFNVAAEDIEDRLQQTKREGAALREKLRNEAAGHRTGVIEQTRSEAEELVRQADAELTQQVALAKDRIVSEADTLARIAAEQILGRSVA